MGRLHTLTVFFALGCLCWAVVPLEARGLGSFLEALLARAVARGAVGAAKHSTDTAKSYTPDVLTVEQLAQCIKKANKLDEDSGRLEAGRAELQSSVTQIDLSEAMIAGQRGRVDQYSRASVEAFNALIDRHNRLVGAAKAKQSGFNALVDMHNKDVEVYNIECAKSYYADDLTAANKLAEGN
jgi:uncharacterized protein (DUF3084 family)